MGEKKTSRRDAETQSHFKLGFLRVPAALRAESPLPPANKFAG